MGKHWKQQVPARAWASLSAMTSPGPPTLRTQQQEETEQRGACEGTSEHVPQKSSWRPTPQWYGPHWSMPGLSGVQASTKSSIYWKKYNDKQPGKPPTTTRTGHQAVLYQQSEICSGQALNYEDDRLAWGCSTKSTMAS